MAKLFYLMGKSSSGKDTIYSKLISDKELNLENMVPYTTRPIRQGEVEGKEYHFTTKDKLLEFKKAGRLIESRCYNTCYGDWYYFTVNDDAVDLDNNDYLIIGTLESFYKTRAYFGEERVVPIYIELDDGIRLERALKREQIQKEPKYKEMCRRFIADCDDFSEDKLNNLGINKRFQNNELEICYKEIKEYIIYNKFVTEK